MKKPKLNTDFGWCVFVGMFILLIFTNLIWVSVHLSYVHRSFNGTSMEVVQDGANNNQSVTNG